MKHIGTAKRKTNKSAERENHFEANSTRWIIKGLRKIAFEILKSQLIRIIRLTEHLVGFSFFIVLIKEVTTVFDIGSLENVIEPYVNRFLTLDPFTMILWNCDCTAADANKLND